MSEQNNTAVPRLRFGTLDWRHPTWLDTHYPQDLPEDWQLGYYANEASAVLLEAAAWLDRSPADLAAWVDETHEDFRFYLLAAADRDVDVQRGLAARLDGRLGALLWPAAPAPPGTLAPVADVPGAARAWRDGAGIRVVLLEVAGLDLRRCRALLEQIAPQLAAEGDRAVILTAPEATPTRARELQTVAELMGLA